MRVTASGAWPSASATQAEAAFIEHGGLSRPIVLVLRQVCVTERRELREVLAGEGQGTRVRRAQGAGEVADGFGIRVGAGPWRQCGSLTPRRALKHVAGGNRGESRLHDDRGACRLRDALHRLDEVLRILITPELQGRVRHKIVEMQLGGVGHAWGIILGRIGLGRGE